MVIQQIASPNHWPGRFGASPKWLILHGTAGLETAQEVAAFFGSTASEVSSHYVIGQDGTVIQCVSEADAAWANGGITGPPGVSGDGIHHDAWWDSVPTWNGVPNPNLVTISIEHVKPSLDNSDQLTAAQQAASFALARDICLRNGIPMRQADASGGITGHYSMDPVNKSRCPGPYPLADLFIFLSGSNDMLQITDPFAATHFVEVTGANSTRWHCKDTGCDIIGGILDYWRKTGGAFRLPRTNEVYGVVPGGSYQVFEGGVLVYDPGTKFDNPGLGPVYAMHTDKDTPGLRQLVSFAGLQFATPKAL